MAFELTTRAELQRQEVRIEPQLVLEIDGAPKLNASGVIDLIFPTVEIDTHGAYNASTGEVTVPVPGDYYVYGAAYSNNTTDSSGAFDLFAYKNSTPNLLAELNSKIYSNTNNALSLNGSTLFRCVAGDKIKLAASTNIGGNTSLTGGTENRFVVVRLPNPEQICFSEIVAARYKVAAQSVNSSDPIDFSSKDFDTHNAVTTGSGWKFKAPFPGIYRVSCHINLQAYDPNFGATETGFEIDLYKNGSLESMLGQFRFQVDQSFSPDANGSTAIQLNANDEINLILGGLLGSKTTAAADRSTWICIERIAGVP